MTIDAPVTLALSELLPPDDPAAWPQAQIEDLLALSHRDYYPLQVKALSRRFENLRDSVAALNKLAKRQGLTRVDSVADAMPLFFDHRVYKSYPLTLIETRDFARLTSWLDRLTTHKLGAMSLEGLATLDDWLTRLDEFGMIVGHSTGTTGKLSFIPRSQSEFPSWERAYNEGNRATTGVDPQNEHVTTFFPGYRGGHQMLMKMLSLFAVPAAGGPDHFHTLYQSSISSDLMSLAARMQAAEDKGELSRLGLDPALIKAREEMIAQGRRREQDLDAWFAKLIKEFQGKRVRISGTGGDLVRTARLGIAKGLKPDFAPGSFIMTAGGLKGLKDAPQDWEAYVKEFFGIKRIASIYGMSEGMGIAPRCSHKHYHIPPYTLAVLLDEDMKELPREGNQTGRFAFFDLLAETYWGGFISGDKVTIHWEEDCPCGWKGPRVGAEIVRFSELEGGDDKISCSGSAEVYNEFMDYVSQV